MESLKVHWIYNTLKRLDKRVACGVLLSLWLLLPTGADAQKIFPVDYAYQADVKVYVVDHAYQSDLKVYWVDYAYAAKEVGKWFRVKYDYQADIKVYFVDHAYEADLKIFYVKYAYEAGWTDNDLTHLLQPAR